MTQKLIGIVSCKEFYERATDDDLLVAEFKKQGYDAERVCWDDHAVDWSRFVSLILRSPWDYSWRMAEFLSWQSRLERLNVRLWNPPNVIRWNSNKRYLRELEALGAPLPPTEWIEPNAQFDLEEILARRGWSEAVLKPVVDAGGWNAQRIHRGQTADHPIYENFDLRERGLIVQEFMPEILSPGEYGIVFFNGAFSHAALKTPTGGEFRTQTQHGGRWSAVPVAPEIMEQAQKILSMIDKPLLYARVDGLIRDGKLILMELEVFEPWLFFEYTHEGEARFVKAFEALAFSARGGE